MAALASPAFGMSTKAKPLDPPEFLSNTRFVDCTAPCASKTARSSDSVVVLDKFLINNFMEFSMGKDVLWTTNGP